MRITADIFEDYYFRSDIDSENENECREYGKKFSFSKCEKSHGKHFLSNFPKKYIQEASHILHYKKVNEMTQQFKKLHVSETAPESAQRFFVFDKAVNSKNMEKSENYSANLDAAPAWLLQYLSKMKNEIKKEVIAELTSGQNEVPSGRLLKFSDMTQETENQKVVHSGIFCDYCDQQICGIRYKCGNCSDFDLCQDCESLPNIHNPDHLFLKIRHPIAFKLYQKQKSKPIPDDLSFKSNFLFMTSFFSAKFLCDETIPDGTVVAPSSHFIKSWRIQNVGTSVWTEAVKLRLVKSVLDVNALKSSQDEVDVPPLKPFEEGIVSVRFNAPSFPGEFKSYWNFVHGNKIIGHKVWCHVVVKEMFKEKTKISPSEVLHSPVLDISIEKDIESQRKEVASIEQVLSAVKEEHDKGNIVPRKLAVSSYTATPNNTPFDLTPPKSPDHQIPVKDIQEITGKNVTSNSKNNDSDDECSILSISSESDTEFVVVPMPKCFDIIESLMSHHLSQMQTEMKSKESNENSTTEQNTTHENFKPLFCASEMVSQETGVPELPEHIESEIKRNAPGVVKKDKTVMFSHTTTDGSSSEISIIESEDNSPVVENAMPLIDSISVAVSNENISKLDVVPEMKYPVPEIFKDEALPKEDLIVEVEENASNLASATFPKYPVEGITSTYEPVPINQNSEERSIQVLPEGLVTGALCAAASVYNTARSVISTIQQSKNERSLSQDAPDNSHRSQASVLNPMDQLVEMGFCNRHQNEQLLKKHHGDVAQAVAELVSLNDNEWYASRHSAPSPPDLFG